MCVSTSTFSYSPFDDPNPFSCTGMTYAELGVFGTLRKIQRCGPLTMFLKLVRIWTQCSPVEVANKVRTEYILSGYGVK